MNQTTLFFFSAKHPADRFLFTSPPPPLPNLKYLEGESNLIIGIRGLESFILI